MKHVEIREYTFTTMWIEKEQEKSCNTFATNCVYFKQFEEVFEDLWSSALY